jgi:type I restriction enzyme, S subunit
MTGLPASWTWSTLESVARWSSGGTPTTGRADYYDGEIPWAVIGDLTDGSVTKTASKITEAGLSNSSAKLLDPGTVLIAMYGGSIGKLGIAAVPMATNQAIAAAVPLPGVRREWLFWWLSFQKREFISAGKGGAQPNISQTVLREWPISVAPAIEQQRIVAAIEEAFSKLDAGEAGLHKVRQQLDRMRVSVLDAAINGLLVHQDKSDVSGEALLMRAGAKPSLLGGLPVLPQGWAWAEVGDVLNRPLSNGRSVQTLENGFPVLRLTCLKNGRIDLAERKNGAWTEAEASGFLVKLGDFLVSRGNGTLSLVGRGGLVDQEPDPIAYPDTLIRVSVNPDVLIPALLAIWWNSGHVRRQLEGFARTTAGIYKVNQAMISQVVLAIPSLAEQSRLVGEIERQFSFIDAAERAVETGLVRSVALRRSILKAAFEGKLVPQDPTDEPASVLLERIRAERLAFESTLPKKMRTKVTK